MEMTMKERDQMTPAAKFTLWLFIVSIILLFGGLTSGYIVSRGISLENTTWKPFELPSLFWYNTVLLVVSSLILQVGLWAGRKGDFSRMKTAVILTFAMGVFFLVAQFLAYTLMYQQGIVFGGKYGTLQGNYIYLLTFIHGLHIVAGLTFLGVILGKTLMGKYENGNLSSFESGVTFWHFLGVLWIYLFVFLILIK